MNAKSIRLEALRFASALDPGDTSNLLSSAHDIEGFIMGISPSDSPLYNRLDHLEKLLYNLQPKWEAVPVPLGEVSRRFGQSQEEANTEEPLTKAKRKPGPKPNPARKGSAKRTAARKRASA